MSYEKKKNSILRVLVEIVLCLMIAIVLVGVVQQFFLAPVAVAGVSMMPTINSEGDKVFVQKKFFKIERDCVVVFYRPNSDDVTSKNPANSISVSEFFNSLPFVNKIPNLTEESNSSAEDYTCVIKRVIGIPGDRIEIRYVSTSQAQLLRNGELVNDFLMSPKRLGFGGVDEGEWTVGEGELFVLGDNRNNSYDSEDYGCIQSSWLMGRVLLAKINGKYKRNI
ncbi:MAG TPA: signal peptidase I [Clostridiales bacterium]|nr:signal peptidase I [Clostridiales bacterium]